jgi:hypothetical protein
MEDSYTSQGDTSSLYLLQQNACQVSHHCATYERSQAVER